jgi:glucose/mannose transport system substrate-binding protein
MAAPRVARAQAVKPRLTAISRWSAGSDGAAITALGKKFEERGGVWQHSPVPGFTTDMINKLRARIIAGDPPACSRLKGPEIAAWSKLAPTVNLDATVAAAGYEKVVAFDLARLHKPGGKWAALPLQVYRTNTLSLSKRAMDKAKGDKIATTWAQFYELGERMKAAGVMHPVANGGTRADDGRKLEAVLAGLNPGVYRQAIMELDDKALGGPEMRAAFAQLRKIADWMDPNTAAQHFSVFLPRFVAGEMGMLIQGGWAQGVLLNGGFKLDDFIIAPGPTDNGKPVFMLNADAFIFWQRKEADLQADQKLMAELVMMPEIQTMYSQIAGSIP